MSDNSNKTPAHIRIPRSLFHDQLWRSLNSKHQYIFLKVLEKAAWRSQKYDDFGVILDIEPGQFCTTIRGLQNLCHKEFSKNDIERGIKKLILCGFLRQEVRHRKMVLTISHPDTYQLIIMADETEEETNLRQTRDKLETQKKNKKKEKNIEEEKETKENAAKAAPSFLPSSYDLVTKIIFCIKGIKPDYVEPKNLSPWLKEADLMITNDRRDPQRCLELLNWAFSDKWYGPKMFKKTVVKYLRDNFDEMETTMQMASKHSASRANLGGKRQTEYDNAY